MEKRNSKNRKAIYFLLSFLAIAFFSIWVFTEEEPERGGFAYGLIINLGNQEVAEQFGVNTTGTYVVNKTGKLVSPVRGGLRMIIKGFLSADGTQIKVGFRGLRVGLTRTPLGIAILIIMPLLIISLMLYRSLKKRRNVGSGEDEYVDDFRQAAHQMATDRTEYKQTDKSE